MKNNRRKEIRRNERIITFIVFISIIIGCMISKWFQNLQYIF